jgi:hypothetical protein
MHVLNYISNDVIPNDRINGEVLILIQIHLHLLM